MVVVVNLSRHPQALSLDLQEFEGSKVREIFGRTHFPDVGRDPYTVTVGAHGYYWLQLESVSTVIADKRQLDTPELIAKDLADFFDRKNIRKLAGTILPAYLQSASWIGARGEDLETVTIVDHRMQTNSQRHFGWMLLQLSYLEGLPELVQLPIAFHNFREEVDYSAREEVIGLIQHGDSKAVLLDALYDEDYRRGLLNGLKDYGELAGFNFQAMETMATAGPQSATLVNSGTEYMLLQSKDYNIKFFRRIDTQDVPDLEIKRMLTRRGYQNAPRVVGTLHFSPKPKQNATLAIFEDRLSSGGTAQEYFENNIQRFAEDLINRMQQPNKDAPKAQPDEIAVTDSIMYADMPDTIQDILGSPFVTKAAELGRTIASYHMLMSEVSSEKNFEKEALSLHYQRSVYAGLKGDIRATLDLLRRKMDELDDDAVGLAEAVIEREAEIHTKLKQLFAHKIEADKIRIHGDFTLMQLSIVDDHFTIRNFDGDPDRTFSQRRLRRSPAKDIANLMRSISYTCGLVYQDLAGGLRQETADNLEDWLRTTNRYLSAEFLTAYRKATTGTRLLPADERDLEVMLDTFRIEKALQELRYDLNYRPTQVTVPLQGILELLE